MTALDWASLFLGVLVLSGVLWMAAKRKSQPLVGAPHEDIPDRVEIDLLWRTILDRPDLRRLTVPRHHRGAIYWHAIDTGFTVTDALELALTPEASAVEYEIIHG